MSRQRSPLISQPRIVVLRARTEARYDSLPLGLRLGEFEQMLFFFRLQSTADVTPLREAWNLILN